MNMPALKYSQINQALYDFVNQDVLPLVASTYGLEQAAFWDNFESLVAKFSERNQALLQKREQLQQTIDYWHQTNKNASKAEYQEFLQDIGYLTAPNSQTENVQISTTNVDDEISSIAGPQLVVPISNARFALNAANARWGSLYDALFGTDVLEHIDGESISQRRTRVINYSKDLLDQYFPLENGSHSQVSGYVVYYRHLLAFLEDGTQTGLKTPCQFVALCGHKDAPNSIVLKRNNLHLELVIDRSGDVGATDTAGIQDIRLESALTSILDFEDSVATVDAQDKVAAYRNFLGLMQGNLTSTFSKNGELQTRTLNPDLCFTDQNGDDYPLQGRSLMLVRNVGHLMDTELLQDEQGNFAPEGIVDGVITSLISLIDLQKQDGLRNSRKGSIYIVKPKMHGPEEVAFSNDLFAAIEDMLNLPRNTIKMGIMDEERRTSVNLAACIAQASERVVFINTGFLDRTGDEIHTSMYAGAFLPKAEIKQQAWIGAYENRNVNTGLACGLATKAQIGKGMWPMPNDMSAMMAQKVQHVESGANTAWVPSPTAATLHAIHYYQYDVNSNQQKRLEALNTEAVDSQQLEDLLTIPLIPADRKLSEQEITQELENNIQGILGYVSRWIQLGIGCSTVPDIHNVGLMEDRATLRISSQHVANWLVHNICTQTQVDEVLQRMAKVVDAQNANTEGYTAMSDDFDNSLAFICARRLVLEGHKQPNGYTEPLLHYYRRIAKAQNER